MNLDWSDIGSLDAGAFLVKVSVGTADKADADRVGISFTGSGMTSYIEVGSEEVAELIQLLNDASGRVGGPQP